jgi:hypothetical protein
MIKLLVVVAAMIGFLAMINAFAPEAWMTGFKLPVGKGVSVPWAFPILGLGLYVAWSK